MDFVVHTPRNKPDTVEVRYDCECGCKPRARYQRGTDDANHEHCCCGQVHFVGSEAGARLEQYLAERRSEGLDTDLQYELHLDEVQAPWGEPVAVAYAVPDHPREH